MMRKRKIFFAPFFSFSSLNLSWFYFYAHIFLALNLYKTIVCFCTKTCNFNSQALLVSSFSYSVDPDHPASSEAG